MQHNSVVHDDAYARAEAVLRQHNPCNVIDGKKKAFTVLAYIPRGSKRAVLAKTRGAKRVRNGDGYVY